MTQGKPVLQVDDFADDGTSPAHERCRARLTVYGRRLLVSRVIDDRRPVAHVAKELGVSRQWAHR